MLASIWLVIETSPCRITSSVIGSMVADTLRGSSCMAYPRSSPRKRGPRVHRTSCALLLWVPAFAGTSGFVIALAIVANRHADFAELTNFEPVARPDQRC